MATIKTIISPDGKKIAIEQRGGTLVLRVSFKCQDSTRSQRRISLTRFGVIDDVEAATLVAENFIKDLSHKTAEEVEAFWFPTSKAARNIKLQSYDMDESYTSMMPKGSGGVYVVIGERTGECLYVGQSKCFSERLCEATHPVMMYLSKESIPHSILYRGISDKRKRLFEESLMIGKLEPTLQFGNVPEPYKSYRAGKKAKNERWESGEILEALRQCSTITLQLWCKQVAMLIYHQSMTVADAISYLDIPMSRSTFKRQLSSCGLNVYNIRRRQS